MTAADRKREQTRKRVQRHRVRTGEALGDLTERFDSGRSLPDPPSRDELLRVLGVLARNGNVAAIRMLLLEYRRAESVLPGPTGGAFDVLAARRRRLEAAVSTKQEEVQ